MELRIKSIAYQFVFEREEFLKVNTLAFLHDLEDLGYYDIRIDVALSIVSAQHAFASDTEGVFQQTEQLCNKKYGLSVGGYDAASTDC